MIWWAVWGTVALLHMGVFFILRLTQERTDGSVVGWGVGGLGFNQDYV